MQIQVQIQTQIQVQYQIGILSAAGPKWLEADCKHCTDQSPWQTTTLNTLYGVPLENCLLGKLPLSILCVVYL